MVDNRDKYMDLVWVRHVEIPSTLSGGAHYQLSQESPSNECYAYVGSAYRFVYSFGSDAICIVEMLRHNNMLKLLMPKENTGSTRTNWTPIRNTLW